jgi:guanosine-3',5'-bis(diphosphate) 3'-pyrophosphohydrolase
MASDAVKQDSTSAAIDRLLDSLSGAPDARELVQRAWIVASKLHGGQSRKSGEPYIDHPVAVAMLLADLRMDPATIAAGLLHDALEDTELTEAELEELFPAPVPELVEGVTKISRIQFDTSREHQIENLRKIIAAMARDIRVIIIKLCDRLHNMRTLAPLKPERRQAIATESLEIYAPIANRLGIVSIKSELEDLAMKFLYPVQYRTIRKEIASRKEEQDLFLERTIRTVRNYLAEMGHTRLEITGRIKEPWSIFLKMKSQGITLEEVHDLFAVRILCDSMADCYEIFGLVHQLWQPVPGRIKDYIGTPKNNGYQSLHTTVVGLDGVHTEIQIRTHEMHQVAEFGIAAHWKYKGGPIDQGSDRRFDWLRQLTEWITDVGDPDSFIDALKKDIFADLVLCFTPLGDVIELPAGATPIDFAYAIHTKIGDRCVGARVNNRIVSLRTKLSHGDRVEIQTSNTGHPSRDWLDVVVTGRARQKIKHWLKSKEMEKWVSDGRAVLARVFKERNIEITKAELDEHLAKLLSPYRLRTIEDLLAEIGFGTISAQAAIARMNPEWSKKRRPSAKRARKPPVRKEDRVVIEGMDEDMRGLIRIANCCSPMEGDPIAAYITRGRGLTVHHEECPNLRRLRATEDEGDRVLHAHWLLDESNVNTTVYIRIEATDRLGLLSEISQAFSGFQFFIVASESRSAEGRGSAVLRFEAKCPNLNELQSVINAVKRVKGVTKVERVGSFR